MFTPKVSFPVDGSKYLEPSPTRKIHWNGFYLSQPLTNGNTKLGSGVLAFDLLAVRTCPNCKDCRVSCYAQRLERFRPNVYNKHLFNTLMAVHDLSRLRYLIHKQLSSTKKRIVRIHSSGDFFSQEYIDMWVYIARCFPKIKFYSYTKTRGIFDFSRADATSNLNIIDSILPDGSINFGSTEYLVEKKAAFPTIPICPVTCGIEGEECMRTCTKCLSNRWMLFKEH